MLKVIRYHPNTEVLMEPEVIIEEWSPLGNIQALVEKTERTYYFYLWINPESKQPQIRSCWICNRIKGVRDIKEALAIEGQEPLMPTEFVDHDPNGIDIDESDLSILWSEEGDAAAVLSHDKLLAVIPSFSGMNGFHGYSTYAKGMGSFAWEMKQAYANLDAQFRKGQKFWSYFDTEYWSEVQDSHMKTLQAFFGEHEKYYAIDRNEFPHKALVTGRKQGILFAFTIAVSMIPMPGVEMSYDEDYQKYRRMELGFACHPEHSDILKRVYSMMSFLAAMPWLELTFLGHGHTIPFDGIPGYDYLLFLNTNEIKDIDAPVYNDFMGERINLLWIRPITKEEYAFELENGVAAYLEDKDLTTIHIF